VNSVDENRHGASIAAHTQLYSGCRIKNAMPEKRDAAQVGGIVETIEA
jgi:hypothetical protein